MAGPIENTNAVKHGARSPRNGIVLAALDKRHANITVDLRRLKRTLNPYVQHLQGKDRLKAIAMVNQIARWEMTARVMQKTIVTGNLSPELMLTYLNGIGQATARRDALLNKLLDGKAGDIADDPWTLLDAARATGQPTARKPTRRLATRRQARRRIREAIQYEHSQRHNNRRNTPTVGRRFHAVFRNTIIPAGGVDGRLGDVWAGFQRDAFQVMAGCLKAVGGRPEAAKRGLWIRAHGRRGQRFGRGFGVARLLMFSRRPQVIELGADDLEQILETYKAMAAIIRCNPWMEDRLTVRANKILCEATASTCDFLTRDASGSHGSRPTVTVCNELSHCQTKSLYRR